MNTSWVAFLIFLAAIGTLLGVVLGAVRYAYRHDPVDDEPVWDVNISEDGSKAEFTTVASGEALILSDGQPGCGGASKKPVPKWPNPTSDPRQ